MVYSDKLFVLTPQGDLRLLLDEGDPKKVEALERHFLPNRSMSKCCSPPARALLHGWRALLSAVLTADGLYRLVEG